MQPRWRLTALGLSLAFSPASVAAQTHYVTGAPTLVSAGAFDPVNSHGDRTIPFPWAATVRCCEAPGDYPFFESRSACSEHA